MKTPDRIAVEAMSKMINDANEMIVNTTKRIFNDEKLIEDIVINILTSRIRLIIDRYMKFDPHQENELDSRSFLGAKILEVINAQLKPIVDKAIEGFELVKISATAMKNIERKVRDIYKNDLEIMAWNMSKAAIKEKVKFKIQKLMEERFDMPIEDFEELYEQELENL